MGNCVRNLNHDYYRAGWKDYRDSKGKKVQLDILKCRVCANIKDPAPRNLTYVATWKAV